MTRYERQPRLQDNYTQIPHGLWTAPISYGAKTLLGWLHSHDAAYLSRLTNNRIREELGASGQVGGWVKELVQAGFIAVEKRGQANRFILLAAPWEALAHRQTDRPEIGHPDETTTEPAGYRSPTGRKSVGYRPEIGHIEEQREEQGEHHLSIASPASKTTRRDDDAEGYERFYAEYPRKKDKAKGARAWAKMTAHERRLALDALPAHMRQWKLNNTESQYIPYPASWLNGKRWEDDIGQAEVSLTKQVARFAIEVERTRNGDTTRNTRSRTLGGGDDRLERRGHRALHPRVVLPAECDGFGGGVPEDWDDVD